MQNEKLEILRHSCLRVFTRKHNVFQGVIIFILLMLAISQEGFGQERMPDGTGYLTECEKAGGKIVKRKECDGAENDYCQLTEKIHCYADMVKNGKCEGVEFSEKWYKETGDGMIGARSGPRVLCDGAEMGQEDSPPDTKKPPQFTGRDQWNLCKEMWLKDKKMPEDTYTWRKITIKEVSAFGGFYAKGYVNNDILFPVHIIPNLDKIDIDTLRQQLKEGSVVGIIGKCDGVTENNKVIIEADEVNLYE